MNTAGLDQFRRSNSGYYKDANGFLLVYDVTDKSSLYTIPQHEKYILENLTTRTNAPPPILMIGELIYNLHVYVRTIIYEVLYPIIFHQIWVLGTYQVLKVHLIFCKICLTLVQMNIAVIIQKYIIAISSFDLLGVACKTQSSCFLKYCRKNVASAWLSTIAQKIGSILDRTFQSSKQSSCRKILV